MLFSGIKTMNHWQELQNEAIFEREKCLEILRKFFSWTKIWIWASSYMLSCLSLSLASQTNVKEAFKGVLKENEY